ncbi:MAG TPA: purine-nucleoside phosphorylase [Luteolibacter sp.]|nr:purine-nucleoside phosphorylase [Luteolibacter sp.]
MTGIVLGSGLGPLAEAVRVEEEVSFERAGLPASTVPGHGGKFIVGKLGREPVVLMSGRVHLYEGHDPRAVTEGVAWLAARGVSRIVLTNAAGSLNPDFEPGSWMAFSDHLNLTGTSPLKGAEFIDMSAAYDPAWRDGFVEAAATLDITLHCGVYAGLRGPQYETPAEVRMLRALGADAVGMSTVLETIRARSLDLPVAAFSCLTNWAAGISPTALDHEEVIATGKKAARDMIRLLEKTIGGL